VITVGHAGSARAEVILGSFLASTGNDYYFSSTATGTGAQTTFETVTGPNTPGAVAGFFDYSASAIAQGAPSGIIAATIEVMATTTSGVSLNNPDSQGDFHGTYSIVGTSGALAGVTLMSATFSGATLSGADSATTITFGDSTTSGGTVNLSNPYFTVVAPEDFSFTLGSLTTPVSTQVVNGVTVYNNSYGSDVQTQSGTISSPEPSSMAIAGLGALGMIGYGLRRRKAKGA
jgi:hypothetical protein